MFGCRVLSYPPRGQSSYWWVSKCPLWAPKATKGVSVQPRQVVMSARDQPHKVRQDPVGETLSFIDMRQSFVTNQRRSSERELQPCRTASHLVSVAVSRGKALNSWQPWIATDALFTCCAPSSNDVFSGIARTVSFFLPTFSKTPPVRVSSLCKRNEGARTQR